MCFVSQLSSLYMPTTNDALTSVVHVQQMSQPATYVGYEHSNQTEGFVLLRKRYLTHVMLGLCKICYLPLKRK